MIESASSPAGTPESKTQPPAGTPDHQAPNQAHGSQAGTPGEPKGPPQSKAQKLAELLKGKDGKSGQPPTAAGAAPGEGSGSDKPKPKKFNELAERVGLELSELYALEVATSADGKAVTVEQLKDHWAKRSDFAVQQLKWEQDRSEEQQALARANAELRDVLSMLPKDALDEKVLKQVAARHEASVQRENAATLRVLPEWRDEAVMTRELAGMAEWMKSFGFPVDTLKTITDHRMRLLLRTAWKREELVKAALAEVEKVPADSHGKSRPNEGKAPSKPRSGPRARGRAGLMAILSE